MNKFIMYGAGNIGRGFIGQLFSQSGYKVGFIDINKEVIGALNKDNEYPVEVVSTSGSVEIPVKNVYGIDGTDIDLVSDEIASADIMATAIGVNVLKFIAKPIALGLKKRFEQNAKPFNIIICENLIGADHFLKGLIKEQLPEYAERIDKEIGFVEASIGRMVPVMTDEKRKGNILRVCVEPYNILPVDKDAFKGEIPEIKNLYPSAPFNYFIQRKLFMHNMSHALCSYLGYLRGYEFIYESVADYDIRYVAYKALTQSALAISKENGTPIDNLLDHAENLLYRFSNVALADTVERVGKDTIRKLGSNDRLVGALKLCEKHNLPCNFLLIGIAAGMFFAPEADASSVELSNYAKENGVVKTLEKYSDYTGKYAQNIEDMFKLLNSGKGLKELLSYCDDKFGSVIRV